MQIERCSDCGNDAGMCKGSSIATIYDFNAMEPSHEHFRCLSCTQEQGCAPSNARPSDNDMSRYERIFAEDIH